MIATAGGRQAERKECRQVIGRLVGGSLLVGLGRSVVLVLLGLVADGITSSLEAVRGVLAGSLCHERPVGRWCLPSADAGVAVLGDLLVGLLGAGVGGALDLVRDVVAGLLDGIHVDWCGG